MRSQLRLRVLLPTAVVALLGVGAAFAFSETPDADEPPPPPKEAPETTAAEPAPAAKAVSRRTWARRANAICRDLTAKASELGTPKSRAEMLDVLRRRLDLADAALADLRELPAPRRDRARIARMLRHFARYLAFERRALAALRNGEASAFARLNGRAFAANDRGNRIARDLGARACAVGGREDTELARALQRHRVVVAVLYSPDATVDRLAIREARAGAAAVRAGFAAIDVYDTSEIAPVAAEYAVRGAPSVLVFARYKGAVSEFEGYVDRATVAQAAANAAG